MLAVFLLLRLPTVTLKPGKPVLAQISGIYESEVKTKTASRRLASLARHCTFQHPWSPSERAPALMM